jgi:hypothetical protein
MAIGRFDDQHRPSVDASRPFDHNRAVRLPNCGPALGFVAAAALVVSGALPPVHVHGDNSAHPNSPIEHWHFSPHHHQQRPALSGFDQDDHDGPAWFLDNSVWAGAPWIQVAPVATLTLLLLAENPLRESKRHEPLWLIPRALGPPLLPTVLRGPPPLA